MSAFKDLFSPATAKQLARALHRAHPEFSESEFLSGIAKALAPLELKDRMKLLEQRMYAQLGDDFPRNAKILVQSLQKNEKDSIGLSGFIVWPLTEYISRRGLAHFEESMAALKEMTKVFTAEFAIRAFLREHQIESLKILKAWAKDENEHVRRLVSEGSRPLLPWSERLQGWRDNPELSLALLDALVNDPSKYVRKSVANHMNDHTKAHPEWAVETMARWRKKYPTSREVARTIKHASRSLLKQGHAGAIALHGYGDAKSTAKIKLSWSKKPAKTLKFGDQLSFAFEITNTGKQPQKVMVDYAMLFKKSSGQLAPKVFKASEKTLKAGEIWRLPIKHRIKAITTRKYYGGDQWVEPRINGRAFEAQKFKLIMKGD